jgi:hypothetical protein
MGTRSNGDNSGGLVESFNFFGAVVRNPVGGYLSSFTRGIAEGGVITILGMVPADLHRKRYPSDLRILGLYAVTALLYVGTTVASSKGGKDVGGSVDSRRELFKPVSVVVTSLFVAVPLMQVVLSNSGVYKRRVLDLFVALCVVGVVTNFQMYFCNVRWVEVSTDDAEHPYKRANVFLELCILMYDGVVEIALMYLPFFTLPHLFNLIHNDDHHNGHPRSLSVDDWQEEVDYQRSERDISDGGYMGKIEPLLKPSFDKSSGIIVDF